MFKLSHELINTLDFTEANPILIEDNFLVEYTPGLNQYISLRAKIYGPELKVTSNFVDFGSCLVNQERCLQVVMRNPSYSSVLWNLSIGKLQNLDSYCLRIDLTVLFYFIRKR